MAIRPCGFESRSEYTRDVLKMNISFYFKTLCDFQCIICVKLTNEQRHILYKDLCMRIPYGVFVETSRNRLKVFFSRTERGALMHSNEVSAAAHYGHRPFLFTVEEVIEQHRDELQEPYTDIKNIHTFLKYHADVNHLIEQKLAVHITDYNPYKTSITYFTP